MTFNDYNNAVYHKDRSLDLSYNQPTTVRFTALVRLLSLPVCQQTFLSQWTAYQTAWMRSNRLQLKAEKNEVMWCASARLVGSHYFLAAPSRSLVLQSNQSALSVTWASTSTVILAPPPMYAELCRAVSPHCDSFVIYIATLQKTAFVLTWSRSSTLGSIMATSCLSDSGP